MPKAMRHRRQNVSSSPILRRLLGERRLVARIGLVRQGLRGSGAGVRRTSRLDREGGTCAGQEVRIGRGRHVDAALHRRAVIEIISGLTPDTSVGPRTNGARPHATTTVNDMMTMTDGLTTAINKIVWLFDSCSELLFARRLRRGFCCMIFLQALFYFKHCETIISIQVPLT